MPSSSKARRSALIALPKFMHYPSLFVDGVVDDSVIGLWRPEHVGRPSPFMFLNQDTVGYTATTDGIARRLAKGAGALICTSTPSLP
jgi:dienelactone hydrolase